MTKVRGSGGKEEGGGEGRAQPHSVILLRGGGLGLPPCPSPLLAPPLQGPPAPIWLASDRRLQPLTLPSEVRNASARQKLPCLVYYTRVGGAV